MSVHQKKVVNVQVEIQEHRSGLGPLALRGQGQRALGTRRRGPPTGAAELPRNTGMVAKRGYLHVSEELCKADAKGGADI